MNIQCSTYIKNARGFYSGPLKEILQHVSLREHECVNIFPVTTRILTSTSRGDVNSARETSIIFLTSVIPVKSMKKQTNKQINKCRYTQKHIKNKKTGIYKNT